jgi:hypothetical protein
MKVLSLFFLSLLGLALAHIRINSVNQVAGSTSARNKGQFDASQNHCGTPQGRGANGYTIHKPGSEMTVVWELNNHPPAGVFEIIFSNVSDTQLLPGQATPMKIAPDVPHTGPGVYQSTFKLPKVACTECSVQIWHTHYNWGGCHDHRLVPDGAVYSSSTNKITCQSGTLKNGACSSGSSSKSNNASKTAGKFFLGLFLFLLIAAFLAALIFGALVVARRKGKLPDGKVSTFVEKGEKKLRLDRIGGGSSTPNQPAAQSHQPPQQQATPTPTAPPATKTSTRIGSLKIGATVQAQYSADGKFYPATVVDLQNGQVLVQYIGFEGSSEWVPYAFVRA